MGTIRPMNSVMNFATHRQIIDAWPDRVTFAKRMGVKYETVKKWHQRNSIPPEKWRDVVRSAVKDDIDGITLDLLAEIRTGNAQRIAAE